MQKEDLLKKLRLWATIITVSFAVLIVGLIVQFGFIAANNTKITQLKTDNAAQQERLEQLEENLAYYQSDAYREKVLLENRKKPN